MARILGDDWRKRTRVFSELVSHYLFEERFGRRNTSRLLKKGFCWLDLADRVSSSHVLVRPK